MPVASYLDGKHIDSTMLASYLGGTYLGVTIRVRVRVRVRVRLRV